MHACQETAAKIMGQHWLVLDLCPMWVMNQCQMLVLKAGFACQVLGMLPTVLDAPAGFGSEIRLPFAAAACHVQPFEDMAAKIMSQHWLLLDGLNSPSRTHRLPGLGMAAGHTRAPQAFCPLSWYFVWLCQGLAEAKIYH